MKEKKLDTFLNLGRNSPVYTALLGSSTSHSFFLPQTYMSVLLKCSAPLKSQAHFIAVIVIEKINNRPTNTILCMTGRKHKM